MRFLYFLLTFLFTFSSLNHTVFAQHEHHQTKPKAAPAQPAVKPKPKAPAPATKKPASKPAKPFAEPKLAPENRKPILPQQIILNIPGIIYFHPILPK